MIIVNKYTKFNNMEFYWILNYIILYQYSIKIKFMNIKYLKFGT